MRNSEIKARLQDKAQFDAVLARARALATRAGDEEVCRVLMDAGASIEAALRYKEGRATLAALGVDVEASVAGRDAPVAAATAKKVPGGDKRAQPVRLVTSGASEEEVRAALAQEDVDVDENNGNGWTGLYAAALSDRADLVSLFLEAGASPAARTKHGETAFLAAAKKGSVEILSALASAAGESADKLADLPAVSTGETPLIAACVAGHTKIASYLLSTHSVNVDAKQKEGKSALALAARSGNEALCRALLGAGATAPAQLPATARETLEAAGMAPVSLLRPLSRDGARRRRAHRGGGAQQQLGHSVRDGERGGRGERGGGGGRPRARGGA